MTTSCPSIRHIRGGGLATPILKMNSAQRQLAFAKLEVHKQKLSEAAYNAGGIDWKRLFDRVDSDKSGGLDQHELKKLIFKAAKIPKDCFPDDAVINLHALLDTNNDGTVDYVRYTNSEGVTK